MIILSNKLIHKHNELLSTFEGTHINYKVEGEDVDYMRDIEILNNKSLKNEYYEAYCNKTKNLFNNSLFSFDEVQKVLNSFELKCDECKMNNYVYSCENNHKVFPFFLNCYHAFLSFAEDVFKKFLL
jgi:hypothetical protein